MFSRSRPDRDDRRKFGSFLAERGSRAEYWIVVGAILLLGLLFPRYGATGGTGVVLVFTVRRLHDFGQTGWWAALPFAVAIPVGVAVASSPVLGSLLIAGVTVGGVMFTAFVGLMPGDAGANRFGEPQNMFGRKRRLSETFS